MCVSSGGIIKKTNLKFYKGFRIKLANKIKQNTNIVVRTSGLIHDLDFANKVIKKNKCDLIAVGRKFILDPNWIQRIKKTSIKSIPSQYLRGLI